MSLGALLGIKNRIGIRLLVKGGLKLGKNCFISHTVHIDPAFPWLITIGNDCTLTQNVIILAHDASTKKYLGVSKVGTVTIGNKCFIGAGTVVLPGVKIGNGVIVGAGSVVTHDIPDNCLAVGNPAKVVKSAADYIEEHKRKLKNRPVYPSKGWTVGKSVNSENKRIMKEELTSGIGYVE